MKIAVKRNKQKDFQLSLPSGIVLNGLSARLITRHLPLPVTGRQAAIFVKALKSYRKQHPEWVFVEVLDADGEQVSIYI